MLRKQFIEVNDQNGGLQLQNQKMKEELQEFRSLNTKKVHDKINKERAADKEALQLKEAEIQKLRQLYDNSQKVAKTRQEIIDQKAQENDTYRH